MKKDLIQRLHKSFEDCARQRDGVEYWFARELQELLGYTQWRNFETVIDKARTASPQNSTAWYWPPFMPKRPIIDSIMSLAETPSARRPLQRMKIVGGTLSQISPVTTTPSISVEPMPNM